MRCYLRLRNQWTYLWLNLRAATSGGWHLHCGAQQRVAENNGIHPLLRKGVSPCHFCYSPLRWGPLEDSSVGVGGIWNQTDILIGCLQMLALIPVVDMPDTVDRNCRSASSEKPSGGWNSELLPIAPSRTLTMTEIVRIFSSRLPIEISERICFELFEKSK